MTDLPSDLTDTISELVLPPSPPEDTTRSTEVGGHTVEIDRRGKEVIFHLPGRDAEKALREAYGHDTGSAGGGGTMQSFLPHREHEDGRVELRIGRPSLIEITY